MTRSKKVIFMGGLRTSALALALTGALACTGRAPGDGGDSSGDGTVLGGGGSPSARSIPTLKQAIPAELISALEGAEALDGAELEATYPAAGASELGYDPSQASGLDLIQASALKLTDSELAILYEKGLVITKRQQFPSYAYGYKSIYGEDLPVYVSADSILQAVHATFDDLLARTEEYALVPDLTAFLNQMRTRIGQIDDAELAADVDLYLAVALGLLNAQDYTEQDDPEPVAGASSALIAELLALARAGEGTRDIELFGTARTEDFSQFKPRGHYTDSALLSAYFQAMMWLGRVDLRIVETDGATGKQVFRRRQFETAAALTLLMGPEEKERFERVDALIGAYVGEHDSATPTDFARLLEDLEVSTLAEVKALSDEEVLSAIQKGQYGAQRIASRIIIVDHIEPEGLPLDMSYRVFGQRYTVDSHTFSNTTYDRVVGRLMPNPLDAAFAALGNNSALSLLRAEFDNTSYTSALARTRVLIDAHEPDYWEGSVYTRWLDALRTLSPGDAETVAGITVTSDWNARILSTQLASWAQARHDTILYAKQSYTAGVSCEFPDAYVDPYPDFYRKLGTIAEALVNVTGRVPDETPHQKHLKTRVTEWAADFGTVTDKLAQMADNELTGNPNSEELIAFINDAVKWDVDLGCGGPPSYLDTAGWYLKLFPSATRGIELDPTIADVHTQPTDEAGNNVGRVLHVGTGMPRLMVVTANTCSGPRAYVGLAASYGELVTENWQRLNDLEWKKRVENEPYPDVPWMGPILAE